MKLIVNDDYRHGIEHDGIGRNDLALDIGLMIKAANYKL